VGAGFRTLAGGVSHAATLAHASGSEPSAQRQAPGAAPKALAGLALVSFLGGMAGAPLQSLFPVYAEADLQVLAFEAAWLRVPLVLLGGLFAIAGGALCDRLGRRRTFVIGLTGGLSAGAVFLTRDFLLIALFCAYAGLMMGFLTTGGQSYLMAVTPRERMGMGSALYFLSGTLGIALGSRAGGWLAESRGFATVGMAMLLLAALVIPVALLLLPETPGSTGFGRRPSALAAYRRLLRLPRVRLLLWLRYLPTCYWGAATQLLSLLVFRATHSKESAAVFAAVSLSFAAACQLLSGRWCDRAGPRRPVLVTATAVAACAALTALGAGEVWCLFLFGTLGAGAAWSLSTTMPRLIHDTAPEGEQGTLVGAAHLAWSAGMLTGILGGGMLVDWWPGAPFAVTAVLCAAAVLVAARLLALLEVHR
jgi:MFS family permease